MFILEAFMEWVVVGLLAFVVMRFSDAGSVDETVIIVGMIWAAAIIVFVNIPKKTLTTKPA